MAQVYDALNAMGETGWRINRDMLAVVKYAWRKSMDICDLPQAAEAPIIHPPTTYIPVFDLGKHLCLQRCVFALDF